MPYTPPDKSVRTSPLRGQVRSTYVPEVDDYVKWNKEKHSVEGWIYYKDSQYITIEIGVRCKNKENVVACPIHEKTHTLVVCFPEYYHQLQYIKTRANKYDEK